MFNKEEITYCIKCGFPVKDHLNIDEACTVINPKSKILITYSKHDENCPANLGMRCSCNNYKHDTTG